MSFENFDKSENQAETVIVECEREDDGRTSCTVEGTKVEGGLVEAAKKGKRLADDRDATALYRNLTLGSYWSLEDLLESCPKLRSEIRWKGKFFSPLKNICRKFLGKLPL